MHYSLHFPVSSKVKHDDFTQCVWDFVSFFTFQQLIQLTTKYLCIFRTQPKANDELKRNISLRERKKTERKKVSKKKKEGKKKSLCQNLCRLMAGSQS